MVETTLEGRWNEKKAAMKKAYPKLTDADVKYVSEGHQELLDNLSHKTGLDEEELIIWLDSL
ncbi:MAG: general stress protein CsbD [Bacteroidota bacterium]